MQHWSANGLSLCRVAGPEPSRTVTSRAATLAGDHGIAQTARVRVARQPDATAAVATASRTASRVSCSGQYWLAGWQDTGTPVPEPRTQLPAGAVKCGPVVLLAGVTACTTHRAQRSRTINPAAVPPMAGRVRRSRAPNVTPRAKASTASPARARLIETNQDQREVAASPAVSWCCSQALAVPAARPATVRPALSMAILARYQRRRDTDWVQATRWVRCSIYLATSGAPIMAPMIANAAGRPSWERRIAKL
jgi:hypothetical protein